MDEIIVLGSVKCRQLVRSTLNSDTLLSTVERASWYGVGCFSLFSHPRTWKKGVDLLDSAS